MAKHTYGFDARTDRAEAITSAVAQAREDGFIADGTAYTTEIVQTDEHRAAISDERPDGEMCVVVRTSA